MICTFFAKRFSGDQTMKNGMGWAYGTYGGEEMYIQGFGKET